MIAQQAKTLDYPNKLVQIIQVMQYNQTVFGINGNDYSLR